MNYLNYCQPKDIAERIQRRHRHWFHGKPSIKLYGDNGSFGKLQFNFGDRIFTSNIYIKDRNKILDAAHIAIENFNDLLTKLE